MFDRPGGLVLYFVLIASAFVSVMTIGDHFVRYAALLAWDGSEEAVQISRVTMGLEAQERSKLWQPISYTSIMPDKVPQISVAELAHNLDEAESRESQKPSRAPTSMHIIPASTHIILVRHQRATHLTKRPARTRRHVARRTLASRKHPANNLTTAQIILRSLTSDL